MASLVAVILAGILWGAVGALGASSLIVVAVVFALVLGILLALGAAATLALYAILGLDQPPAFADPTVPLRELEEEDFEGDAP